MSSEETGSPEKDIYDQLMPKIEAGRVDHAVDMVMALDGRDRKFEILSRLSASLDHALDIRGASTLDLDRARALVRARDRARELTASLDLDHAYALETALERARALYLALDRASLITKTITACLDQLDENKSSLTDGAPAVRSRLTGLNQNLGRLIIIALLCILLCLFIAWVLMLRAQTGAA